MRSLPTIIDNATTSVEDVYGDVVPESEEIRIATGYFYLSGFDLLKEDLDNLRDPDGMDHAPLRILMGRQTDRRTADEVTEGKTLREEFKQELKDDIEDLNNAQLGRLERLRDFIGRGLVDVRVRNPEQGYFHAKGATFRLKPDDPSWREGDTDERGAATIVGSSNFSRSGHRHNVELNLTSQNRSDAEAFEEWYDNQWANSSEFSDEIIKIIETSDRYQQWKEQQEEEGETEDEDGLGTYLEPFEMYKLLAYDELRGNVSIRDSPLYYFQTLGYESADEKLSRYNGCIVSDSVGLGKSFIGSELLYDYRSLGKRCLLIVPANLTNQWRDLLQDATDEDGDPFFGLEVDGTHLDVISISKFQNLSYKRIQELRDQFDVLLIDEAHRFRNFGQWRPNPTDDDDYKGTRRHANLRQFRGHKMIMLTATPINNSATDLKNLISLFTSAEELQNKASLNFKAFDNYIETAAERKRIAKGEEEATEDEQRQLTERLSEYADVIGEILNEVMVLRTRNHVKELIQENEDFDMRFQPPALNKEEYTLPDMYQPIYQMLPDVMDALHLPHITIKNPRAGSTLKALYKLNLLKRLESSTYAFVQSVQTLHESERALLGFLDGFPEDEKIDVLRAVQDGENKTTLADFVEGEDAVEDLEETLEEFGFDTGAVKSDDGDSPDELVDATVGEVKTYIREDLTLLAYFLSQFIGRVALDSGDVGSEEYAVSQWLSDHGAGVLPSVPEDEVNPILYPRSDLVDADSATLDYYRAVFALREFRDPKIDRLVDVLGKYEQKVLIFTQYRATADYVHRTLVENSASPLTDANSAVVKGGDDNKQDIIKRFAPEASGYQQTLAESGETELQYVVATDTLSEGVNLQDISVVVNYDLPWNPMKIVQRVGRIDRIGSTDEKYVHNFYPDGDIEAAIKLLKRLQAKINDIALIVGKENNILDPNENATLDKVGVDTQKTIGEQQVEEVGKSIQASRDAEDYNELDDTSKNPLLQGAGSDENAAYQRYLLKQELNEEFELSTDDFEFAEEFFETPAGDRDLLYTRTEGYENAPRSGVFGLAHMWFEDEDTGEPDSAPLGRVRRAFYYKPRQGDVDERPVLHLKMTPETEGEPISGDGERALGEREAIAAHLDERLTRIREGQVGRAFEQGDEQSPEQETLLSFIEGYILLNMSEEPCDREEYETIGEWATDIRDTLDEVRLKNTDEDRVLRETFRDHEEYTSLTDWPVNEFLGELDTFVDEYIDASPEFQETLVGESAVQARLVCWGVVGR